MNLPAARPGEKRAVAAVPFGSFKQADPGPGDGPVTPRSITK
jgi:hypothetical protein